MMTTAMSVITHSDIWYITLFVMHFAAAMWAAQLFPSAPCGMQKIAIGLAAGAFAILAVANVLAIADIYGFWYVKRLGYDVLEVGVGIYIFRLWYDKKLGKLHERNYSGDRRISGAH